MGDSLEFNSIFNEEMGALYPGRLKFSDSSVVFKNEKTGKLNTINTGDLVGINWQRLGNKPGIKLMLKDGTKIRFGGFKDDNLGQIDTYAEKHWNVNVDQQNELQLKGWNHGNCQVKGKSIEFTLDERPVFEIPLSNVSNCVANKNEATIEFHQNDDCHTSLMEMRFHMPVDPDDEDADPVEEFRKAVMAMAGVETESGQPVASLSQILCMTPRGRYDIKVYPNHLSLHGKTYDYKIPMRTIMRLFLVPHKDGRHMYFVIHLNPPIRQGQTRYGYLVLEFTKEEEVELTLGLTDDQVKEFDGKLEREMSGPVFELVSKIFRVLVNMKITVPGSFIGNSGTPAVQCAHRQASGFLYPLEKGFLYIHKPPMYVRFEEISSVHFARSDVSTRSFDFEIEMKSGQTLIFNSVEKEEYNKLYDYVQSKHLRIRNAKKVVNYAEDDAFAGSDEETIDPYKAKVKAEGKEREVGSDEDSEEDADYDLDEDLKQRKKHRESSEGSGSEPEEEYDSDARSSDDESGETAEDDDEEEEAPKKKKKETKEKKERGPREKKGGGKKSKDPNAPKRASSAYMLWFNQNRASIKKDGDGVADTARRAGEMWKKMGEDDKKPYEEEAKKDKERYEKEMNEYKKSGKADEFKQQAKEGKEKTKKPKTPKTTKAAGPSPSKAKSKEYISDSSGSEESDDDKPLRPKDKATKKEESSDSGSGSGSEDSD